MRRRRSFAPYAVVLFSVPLSLVVASCGSSDTPKSGIASGCTLSSDCNGDLICSSGRCHVECGTTKDCKDGTRCVVVAGSHVCQLPDETSCSSATCVPPAFKCAEDNQCRNACDTSSSCVSGQVCASSKVCAEPTEVDPSGHLTTGDSGAGGASGTGGASSTGGTDAGEPDASLGAGGVPGSGGSGATGGSSGAEAGPPPCDPAARPSDALGLFVAPGGSDTNTGVRLAPFATLSAAAAAALSTGRTRIYLAPGAYQGTLTLKDLGPGLTIQGGFVVTGQTWTTDCSATARENTVLIAPSFAPAGVATLTLGGALGTTVLRTLTVQSKLAPATTPPGQSGESLVAVFVDPTATGSLSLEDVWVQAARGGDGMDGAAAVALASACTGKTCSDGSAGVSGAAGATPDRGLFGVSGYLPGMGGDATPGTYGAQGTKTSGTVGTCAGCTTSCSSTPFDTTGTCGCGGPGAAPGRPGGGGGASVAVYVSAGTAVVTIVGGKLEAAGGGDGAAGAAPSAPENGKSGAKGTGASCFSTCTVTGPGTCTVSVLVTTPAAAAGGNGGNGGPSVKSGDGVGGPSYSLVVLGSPGRVTTSQTELAHGAGGQDPSSSVAASGERYDAPSCGNGTLDPAEQCDDGNRLDDDACANDCKVRCSGPGEVLDPGTGACFVLLPGNRTFGSSRAACQNRGSGWDLATFGTSASLTFAVTRLGATSGPFIGAVKNAADVVGSVNGLPLPNPLPWVAGEPNGAQTETCVQVTGQAKLNDAPCLTEVGAICERVPPNFQLPSCGNGTRDPFEECDDGNANGADGCAVGCYLACTTGQLDFATRSCLFQASASGQGKTWSVARAQCQALGVSWDLIKPANLAELTAAWNLAAGGKSSWMGATSDPALVAGASAAQWKWVDGTDVDASWVLPANATSCARYGVIGNLTAASCSNGQQVNGLCSLRVP